MDRLLALLFTVFTLVTTVITSVNKTAGLSGLGTRPWIERIRVRIRFRRQPYSSLRCKYSDVLIIDCCGLAVFAVDGVVCRAVSHRSAVFW